ncbi:MULTISPECIES: HD domain-containing protein [unclassified Breznakia]|uniref:CCA tRNA nucleotidyltransferase n=1 Tax=unclassified Breznakia TaxID=2623764 RepID=UPI002407376A|nr:MULTISPECIES: HD domain-containing protein [unclassified Breznakia]MDF9838619.1 tRNA nucleotidyltransferase (CCA-adding enzyme) [Breznakia sp. PFB2-8]MDF9860644.1 tRNA nucleotidyltransferase (CCA-adding enzyme) [Breznakia sp. PH5-24]
MYNIHQSAKKVLSYIHSLGYEAFLVGGCVRDFLMNRDVHDFDITTSCDAFFLLEKAKADHYLVIPTGLKHGTITFVIDNEHIEVTTYRQESDYIHHRIPKTVTFTNDLKEDLKRRDFTINAICLDQNQIIDYYGGQNDIKAKIIRCIGNPKERFHEDALRILRALRFAFTLGFTIEKNTYTALQESVDLLNHISKERIRDEFIKMLASDYKDLLITLKESKVLLYIIPEYNLAFHVTQESPYHIYDVFHHLNSALNASIGEPLNIRLAILLHDLEKRNYKTIDEKGIAHFKGHAHASAELSKKILRDLKFSNDIIKNVYMLIYYHDYYVSPKKNVLRKFLYKLNGDYKMAYDILHVQKLDNLGKDPTIVKEKNKLIDDAIACIKEMEKHNEVFSINHLSIDGNDIKKLGYREQEIGIVLHKLVKYIVNNQDKNTKDQLLKIAGGMKNEIFNRK